MRVAKRDVGGLVFGEHDQSAESGFMVAWSVYLEMRHRHTAIRLGSSQRCTTHHQRICLNITNFGSGYVGPAAVACFANVRSEVARHGRMRFADFEGEAHGLHQCIAEMGSDQ